jgi:assimilatory nitrate reductase catalytic subunit
LQNPTWWPRIATADGHEYRIATDQGPMMWHDFAYGRITADAKLAEHLEDRTYRAAVVADGEVDELICIGPADQPLELGGLDELEVHDAGSAAITKMTLMETEPVVCACFGIGIDCVRNAIASGQAGTVAEIGQITRAGTNCGSCLPELKQIVAQERATLRERAESLAPVGEPAS